MKTNYKVLPLPPHFQETKELAGTLRRINYMALQAAAFNWRKQHHIMPAASDKNKIMFLIIDSQITFCQSDAELYVGGRDGKGAINDGLRVAGFIYRNLPLLTSLTVTLDTHKTFQIFLPPFWEDVDGNPPPPMTTIGEADILEGKWRPTLAAAHNAGGNFPALEKYVLHYVRTLAKKGQYALYIWPYHGMLGGVGHALIPEVEEAVFFHSLARGAQSNFEIKGGSSLTENYSVIEPEVMTDEEGRSVTEVNVKFLEMLDNFDAIIIAGEAKSHCVAWTIEHLLNKIQAKDPKLANKVYLLGDCSSAVVIPGTTIDFTDQAEAAYERFAAAGMNLVSSTDDIRDWPVFQ
jgi:nicotinamidase-related amidase